MYFFFLYTFLAMKISVFFSFYIFKCNFIKIRDRRNATEYFLKPFIFKLDEFSRCKAMVIEVFIWLVSLYLLLRQRAASPFHYLFPSISHN